MDAPVSISFWQVTFTFRRLEWGSVQRKVASISFTLLRPFIYLRQRERSSGDSNAKWTHGGLRYLLHSLQCARLICLGIPSLMSILDWRQFMHVVWPLTAAMSTPHMQHLILWAVNVDESISVSYYIFSAGSVEQLWSSVICMSVEGAIPTG